MCIVRDIILASDCLLIAAFTEPHTMPLTRAPTTKPTTTVQAVRTTAPNARHTTRKVTTTTHKTRMTTGNRMLTTRTEKTTTRRMPVHTLAPSIERTTKVQTTSTAKAGLTGIYFSLNNVSFGTDRKVTDIFKISFIWEKSKSDYAFT